MSSMSEKKLVTLDTLNRYKEKKKVQRKKLKREIQKQKDFLDHKIDKG